MSAKGRHHLGDGQPRGVRVMQDARHERLDAPLVLVGWMSLCRCCRDERSEAAFGLDDASALELDVNPCYGVGVDLEMHGELPHGRKLVAGFQSSRRDRRTQPALELGIYRRWITRVDGDDIHST